MIDFETAAPYLDAGLAVLPAVRERKCPAIGSWKPYQEQLPTAGEVESWFADPRDALCVVCGKVSNNLEVIDFDNHGELFPKWRESIAPELCKRLVIEKSPSGGFHVFYRCADLVSGNTKLAQGEREGKLVTLIETRGEGGLCLCSPSDGYELIQGRFTDLPTLTADEREDLLAAAVALNEHTRIMEEPTVSRGTAPIYRDAPAPARGEDPNYELRPGDDYNARGDFRALLTKHGWTELSSDDRNTYFRRPGKTEGSHSATFDGQTFFVFSSNAAPFEPGVGYSPFTTYAMLEHAGDFTVAARELLSLGYGKKRVGVVESTVLIPPVEPPEPVENLFADPGPFPKALLEVPGFMQEYLKLCLSTAPYPNEILALGGGLTFLSLLIGRVFKDEAGTTPNIYWASLAESGSGKEHPRKINKRLALAANLMAQIGDSFASGEGIEDALYGRKRMLYQIDELDSLFNTLHCRDARAEGINRLLLTLYSAAGDVHVLRSKARSKDIDGPFANTRFIENPYLVLMGSALPKFFYGALSERVLENGLLARMLIVDAGERGNHGDPKDIVIGDRLRAMLLAFRNHDGGEFAISPNIKIMPESPEVKEAKRLYNDHTDERYQFFSSKGSGVAQALWARSHEKACKLAMLYAASENPSEPKITETGFAWASALVEYLTRKTLYMADVYSFRDAFDKDCKAFLEIVRRAGAGGCPQTRLARGLRRPKDQLEKIFQSLYDQGKVDRTLAQSSGGRPALVYYLI